jgi:hypothetical protein
LRGYNDSDKPQKQSAYHPDHIIVDIKELLDHLGNLMLKKSEKRTNENVQNVRV